MKKFIFCLSAVLAVVLSGCAVCSPSFQWNPSIILCRFCQLPKATTKIPTFANVASSDITNKSLLLLSKNKYLAIIICGINMNFKNSHPQQYPIIFALYVNHGENIKIHDKMNNIFKNFFSLIYNSSSDTAFRKNSPSDHASRSSKQHILLSAL